MSNKVELFEKEIKKKVENIGSSYTLSSKDFSGLATYVFDLDGDIMSVQFESMEKAVRHWLSKIVPRDEDELIEFVKLLKQKGKDIKKVITPADLSFERFWHEYDQKAAKKKVCQALWAKLTDTEKKQVLLHIPVYKSIKRQDQTAMMYPDTFLRNQNWT